jgi:hypothetical protein
MQRKNTSPTFSAFQENSAIAFNDMRNSGQKPPPIATTTYCEPDVFVANGRSVPYTDAPKSHTRREAGPESADQVDNKIKKPGRRDSDAAEAGHFSIPWRNQG